MDKKTVKIKKLQVIKFEVQKGETFEFNGNTKTEHDRVKGIFLRFQTLMLYKEQQLELG